MKRLTIVVFVCLAGVLWTPAMAEQGTRAPAPARAPAAAGAPEAGPPPAYDAFFADGVMRVDVMHTGGHGGAEEFSLDDVRHEEAWPGRRTDLVDPTGYGQYRFRVTDAASGRLVFSQGFASLFGEWLTTEEATRLRRSMHESLRFPYPRGPVTVAIDGRDRQGRMQELFRVDVNPSDHNIGWERRQDFPVLDLFVAGPPAEAVDVLILGDGYTAEEMPKFRADARRFAEALFEYEPYRAQRGRISVRAVEVASRETGTDEPRKGIWRDTALSCSFNTFDSERYLTTEDNRAMRDIASLAPYEAIVLMVNTTRYGGGGIFNLYNVFAADSDYAEYIFIHELGHSFGALGDEYHDPGATSYDEEMFYPRGVEPWEPNITALLDPANLRWGDMVVAGTPIPTPATAEYADRIGAFEGAGYQAHGLYRPCFDSIMFHKVHMGYCPVSERAITRLVVWTANGGWR
jgi:hypothetical protein